ncbi:CHASE2 domain-containing protein [Marinoscillum pacificum]|uniref:CHASE2 domain-containing protein n=1 Tax=Marinoscillum pacificum TaxID=392723 RepID=UPI0021577893|nr:CHASE2 domain-containing protein [Marinoscillum pacificum]
MFNAKLFFESFLATILVFAVLGIFSIFPYDIKFLNPIKILMKDFKYTDIYYSKLADKDKPVNNEIVMVNIGTMDRMGIAAILNGLQQAEPAVIGVDIMFYGQHDPDSDMFLKEELSKPNVVVTSVLHDEEETPYILTSHSSFGDLNYAYADLVAGDSLNSTIREIMPFYDDGEYYAEAFTSKILEMYDPEAFKDLENRGNEIEIINYYGTYKQFVDYEGEQIIYGEFDPETIKDKIVLLGYMGNFVGDASNLEDFKYTPLNHEVVGKSIPDMHGLTIHANILTMYMHRQYIDKMHTAASFFLDFIVCYVHVVLFMFLFVKMHLWYHLWAKVIQFLTAVVLIYILFYFYEMHHYLINATLILITVLISVDVLYLYETLAVVAYKRFGWKSYFIHEH